MKASKILQEYAEGRRDFRNLSLRGQSFRGKNLSGADFSGCDLRGTNFRAAILKKTKFCQAKAGLQKRLVVILILIPWLTSLVSGLLSFFIPYLFISFSLQPGFKTVLKYQPCILVVFLTFLFSLIIHKGLGLTLVLFTLFTIISGLILLLFLSLLEALTRPIELYRIFSDFLYLDYLIPLGIILVILFILTVLLILIVALTGTLAKVLAKTGILALFMILIIGLALALPIIFSLNNREVTTFSVVGIFTFSITILGSYLSWRSLKGDPRDKWIGETAIAFAATGGTSFYGADLTNADFTEATLKSTDFREAILKRTCWRKTKKIDRIRPGKTILANESVRDLMVTGKGENKFYERANLRGANLRDVNLNYANLKFADLSESTLEEADLEYANLTEVNAVETNFTKAKMTGVCLEAWNIDSKTKLDEVDCQFVYLLEHPKPKTDDRERRPSSGIFKQGEFTKLFQEVLNTVDLIFQDGIDWKAFVTAFKKLQIENEDFTLEIQSIENKGDGIVVVKVAVPPDTNKEKIHEDFTQNYKRELKLIEDKYKAQLNAKENEIAIYRHTNANMQETIKLLANRPIQIENTNIQRDENMSNTRNITSTNYTEGDSSRTTNIHDQGINVERDYINNPETKQNLAEAAGEIQKILNQLSENYPTETKKEKKIFAVEVIDLIEQNPSLTQKLVSAIKAGSLAALESMLNHPAASFVIAAMEDLQDDK